MAEDEYPRQQYFPGAKAVLRVRFDSFNGPEPPPPAKRQNARKGKGKDEQTAELSVREHTTSTGQLVLRLEAPGDAPEEFGGPMFTLEPGRDFGVALQPKTATLGRNGLRTADTLTMEFKYEDLPLDPRTVQSCSVELFLGTVSAEDFAAGIGGASRPIGEEGADTGAREPLHLVPDEYTDEYGRTRSNVRFQGWVDSWEVEFPEDGEPVVLVECTDNTRLLIDQPAPPKLTVGPDVALDRAVVDYLANFPQFRGFQVLYLPPAPADGVPTLDSALSKTARKEQLGPAPAQGGGGSSQMSVWDYLTDVAGMVGHTIRIEGVTIIIQRARALLKDDLEQRYDDPFTRTDDDGTPLPRRLFVYGRNIVDMRFGRNFTEFAPRNIEVRSYVGRLKKTLVARFPRKDNRQSQVRVGGKNEQKFEVVRVQGIENEKTLRSIAQGVYESRARQEMSVNFVTRNLASFGGGALDPDVLDMLPGDALDLEVTRTAPEDEQPSTVTTTEDILSLRQRAADRLVSFGYPEELAAQYADAFVNVGVPTTFRVRKMGIDWDEEEGIDIEVEAVNYLVVRADADLPDGEEVEPSEFAGGEL